MSDLQEQSTTEIVVSDKWVLLKELYDLIISQQVIPFTEKVWYGLNANSTWKSTYLDFCFDNVEFQIRRDVRIKITSSSTKGIIGEERYYLGHPECLRIARITMWAERINAHIVSTIKPTEVIPVQTNPIIVAPTAADSDRKVCKTCKVPKPTTDFSPHKSNKDKLYADCKVCNSENAKNERKRKRRLETYISEPVPSQPSIKIPVSTITDQERKNNLNKFKEDNLKKFLNL